MLINLVAIFAVDILSFRLFSSVEIVGEEFAYSVREQLGSILVNSGNVSD